MKIKILMVATLFAAGLCGACNGDHSTRVVRDTVDAANVHDDPSIKDAPSNIDTSKTTTTTGDASDVDNSGSGGTKIVKDTASQKTKPNK